MNEPDAKTRRRRIAPAGQTLRAGRAAGGFSMLELVIVILIIGIIAAVAQPRFAGALASFRAAAAAERIAADLNYAASLARVSSQPVIIRFYAAGDSGSHYYRFERLGDPYVPGRPADPAVPATWYTVRLSDEPYDAQWVETPAMVEFDIYGLPDRDAQWVVRSGNRQRTVTCGRSTGKAAVL